MLHRIDLEGIMSDGETLDEGHRRNVKSENFFLFDLHFFSFKFRR